MRIGRRPTIEVDPHRKAYTTKNAFLWSSFVTNCSTQYVATMKPSTNVILIVWPSTMGCFGHIRTNLATAPHLPGLETFRLRFRSTNYSYTCSISRAVILKTCSMQHGICLTRTQASFLFFRSSLAFPFLLEIMS